MVNDKNNFFLKIISFKMNGFPVWLIVVIIIVAWLGLSIIAWWCGCDCKDNGELENFQTKAGSK